MSEEKAKVVSSGELFPILQAEAPRGMARLSDGLLTREDGRFLAEMREPAQGELWPRDGIAAEWGGADGSRTVRRRKAVASARGLAYSSSKAS